MVSFNTIPTLLTPGNYIEFDNTRALPGLPGQPHKILVIGQRLATGTVAEGVVKPILSEGQAEEYFGRGSMLAEMCAAAKKANRLTEMHAVALDEVVGGTAATAAPGISVTGTATAAGTIALYIAGKKIPVSVAVGDTAVVVAASINAAISAETGLPLTSALDAVNQYEVDLTAAWKGETGNYIDVRVNYYANESLPAGINLALTPLAGGATNPDIATALAAIGDTQYNTIIQPFTDAANLTALNTELTERWKGTSSNDGQAFTAAYGTLAELTTLGTGQNSPHNTILGEGKAPQSPWIWAAVLGAIDAAEPDPARPRQTLHLVGLMPPSETDRYTREERDLLLGKGIATHIVDGGGRVLIERLVTTYQKNAAAVPDASYRDIETMRTLSYLRFSRRARLAQRFPRHKLAGDGTRFGPGQAVVTPSIIKADAMAWFQEMERAGLVEGFDQFKKEYVVERDSGDVNRVNEVLPPDLINQLRVTASQIQFLS